MATVVFGYTVGLTIVCHATNDSATSLRYVAHRSGDCKQPPVNAKCIKYSLTNYKQIIK
nr:MAG TPA: hypothetical protein [Caudoviricetes sp.]